MLRGEGRYLPALSDSEWPVRRTGCFSLRVTPAAVIARSCIASSRALCVLGGVRLISSARIILAKRGPSINLNSLLLSRISVPMISEGIRSGVNWIRLYFKSNVSEIAVTSKVLASPGTPISRQCPLLNIEINTLLMTSSCPTIF